MKLQQLVWQCSDRPSYFCHQSCPLHYWLTFGLLYLFRNCEQHTTSGCCRCRQHWHHPSKPVGESVNTVVEGGSYHLENFTVRPFHFKKYLNQAKSQSFIEMIDDIGAVIEQETDEEISIIHQVKIIGVSALDTYKSCLLCKASIEPMTPPLGKCSKAECAMIQRYDMCPEQASAKLLLQYQPDSNQSKLVQLHAFNQQLLQLCNLSPDQNVTSTSLLNGPTFTSVTYIPDRKVITSCCK